MPIKTVYWFNDTSDPKTCAGSACPPMEAWYDDYPARPHGGLCDCSIWSYFGYAKRVYKNFQETDGGDVVRESSTSDSYPNPHPTKDVEVGITVAYEVKRKVEVSVEEVMEHFGFSGSSETTKTITRDIPVAIPPKHQARVTITISGSITHFTAEKWAVFAVWDGSGWITGAPDQGEVFEGVEEGGLLYEEHSNVDVEIELEPL